jgi:hypothetical protein
LSARSRCGFDRVPANAQTWLRRHFISLQTFSGDLTCVLGVKAGYRLWRGR